MGSHESRDGAGDGPPFSLRQFQSIYLSRFTHFVYYDRSGDPSIPRSPERSLSTLHSYGPAGLLGFPLSEKQARNLGTLLKALPNSKEFEYRKTVFLKAPPS